MNSTNHAEPTQLLSGDGRGKRRKRPEDSGCQDGEKMHVAKSGSEGAGHLSGRLQRFQKT